jgi:hypothetical protein
LDSLANFTAAWQDTPEAHQRMLDAFTLLYEADPALKAHREWVKANGDGCCGADEFHFLWKLLVQEMPDDFRFLEIGVFRGQTTSLVAMLAEIMGKYCRVIGVSPFDGRAMVWPFTGDVKPEGECNDFDKVWDAWQKWVGGWNSDSYRLELIKGDSTDPHVISNAGSLSPYDIAYIDGCHQYEYARQDLANYMPMVKVGGFLVCDDAAWNLKLPGNWFFGFEGASKAVDEVLPPLTANEEWEHCGSLVHLRVFKRLK